MRSCPTISTWGCRAFYATPSRSFFTTNNKIHFYNVVSAVIICFRATPMPACMKELKDTIKTVKDQVMFEFDEQFEFIEWAPGSQPTVPGSQLMEMVRRSSELSNHISREVELKKYLTTERRARGFVSEIEVKKFSRRGQKMNGWLGIQEKE